MAKYGEYRVIDTPLAELSIVGIAIGLALNGLRPLAEIQFADFIQPAYNQIANEAARMYYRTGGAYPVPMVLRTPYGGGIGGGLYHSQSIEATYAHVPGLKVVVPSNPYDAKGLLKSAIRDASPVIFLENEILYGRSGEVPKDADHVVPIGKARVVRKGAHVTIASFSRMMETAMAAAEQLAKEGIEAEVIDLRTIRPLDTATIVESVKKTNRFVSLEEGWPFAGIGAELCALMMEQAFDWLDAPAVRVTGEDVPMPYAANLEALALPSAAKLIAAVKAVMYRS
jgi:pyruvate dehydrogenase E1 component beta subunit